MYGTESKSIFDRYVKNILLENDAVQRIKLIKGIEMGVQAYGLKLPPNTDLDSMSLEQLEALRQVLLKQRAEQVNNAASQVTAQGKTTGNVNGEQISVSGPGNATATSSRFIPGAVSTNR